MTIYSAESFHRATIRQSTASNQSVPYTLKVSKIPTLTNGLLTISPNTSNEEIIEYNGVDSSSLTITVVKNGINPSSQLLTTNGVDYNNPTYIKAHSQNDVIRGDVNHIHINQASSNSTLATNLGVGISKLSVAAVDPGNPIVVGDNDPRLVSNLKVYSEYHAVGAVTGTFTVTAGFQPKMVKVTSTAVTSSAISMSYGVKTAAGTQTITTYYQAGTSGNSNTDNVYIIYNTFSGSVFNYTCTITATGATFTIAGGSAGNGTALIEMIG